MRVEHFDIAGPFALAAPHHGNMRGDLTEAFNLAQLWQHGLVEDNWVQDIHSLSVEMHTWRGMDSNINSKTHDRGLNGADTGVAMEWPLPKQAMPALSDKDRDAPMLRSFAVELREFA